MPKINEINGAYPPRVTGCWNNNNKITKITEIIQKNFTIAKSLQINGTPSFVIGTTIVRGARDLDTLKWIVNQTRKAKLYF